MQRTAKELRNGQPRFVSFVERGANRKAFKVLKRDDGEDVMADGSREIVEHLEARKSALERVIAFFTGRKTQSRTFPSGLQVHAVTPIQTVVFSTEAFTAAKAASWLDQHDLVAKRFEEVDGVIQATVHEAAEVAGGFETVELDAGVGAVVAEKSAAGDGAGAMAERTGITTGGRVKRQKPPMEKHLAFATNAASRAGQVTKCTCPPVESTLKAGNVEALAQHFANSEHPFSDCMESSELEGYDPEARRAICGRVKALQQGGGEQAAKVAAVLDNAKTALLASVADGKFDAVKAEQIIRTALDGIAGGGEEDMGKLDEMATIVEKLAKKVDEGFSGLDTRIGEIEKKHTAADPETVAKVAEAEAARMKPLADAVTALSTKVETGFKTLGERVEKIETATVARKGAGALETRPLEARTARKSQGSCFDTAFPWGRPAAA